MQYIQRCEKGGSGNETKERSGTHCMRMCQISQEFHGIVSFPYNSVNDDAISCLVSSSICVADAHYQFNGKIYGPSQRANYTRSFKTPRSSILPVSSQVIITGRYCVRPRGLGWRMRKQAKTGKMLDLAYITNRQSDSIHGSTGRNTSGEAEIAHFMV